MHKRFSTHTAIVTLAAVAVLGVSTTALALTAQCSDGVLSNSANFHGACSHHRGVEVWLNEAMQEQANAWCDAYPDLCDKSNSHWVGIAGHGNHPYDNATPDADAAQRQATAARAAAMRAAAGHDPGGIVLRGGGARDIDDESGSSR
jgi:hypothetical protein